MSKKARKSNIELLRIIAMFLIIAHHYAIHGIISNSYQLWSTGMPVNKLFTMLMMPGGQVGVALFFIITGYFQVNRSTFSLNKVITVTFFYSVFSLIVWMICNQLGYVSLASGNVATYILHLFLPFSGQLWWFASTYVLLMIISPSLNRLINDVPSFYFLLIVLFAWLFWYIFGYIYSLPLYNLLKAVFFYMIGALYQKQSFHFKRRFLTVSVIVFIFGWCIFAAIEYLKAIGIDESMFFKALQVGLAVPACALALFHIGATSVVSNSRFINQLAAATYGIYLLHDSNITRPIIWSTIFQVQIQQYPQVLYPLYAIITIILVFLVGFIVEQLRTLIFKLITKLIHK